jgi:protein arginine N-methyltransferase 1
MVVADVGTGTGPLARFAAAAGALKVFGIEQQPEILAYAKRLNQTEGLDHIIELVPGDSREVVLGERVDVIVAELIASLGNDEAMSPILEDARRRFLKPGGTIIPRRVDVFICPVSASEMHARIPLVYRDDVIVHPNQAYAPFGTYYQVLGLPPERLLADAKKLDSINLMTHTMMGYERKFAFTCRTDGAFSGFAGWFKAALTEKTELDTSPWAAPTCWGQAFFAVRNEVSVQEGDIIELTFSARVTVGSDRPFYRWEGLARRGARALLRFQETSESSHVRVHDTRALA